MDFTGKTVYIGDSITRGCDVNGINLGMPGATTFDVLYLVNNVFHDSVPDKVYLMIGINDIQAHKDVCYYERMTDIISALDADISVFHLLQTAFPYQQDIMRLNSNIDALAGDFGLDVIHKDIDPSIHTADGLHLNEEGCDLVFGPIL
jgi:lysophospholipase L1-like esterase